MRTLGSASACRPSRFTLCCVALQLARVCVQQRACDLVTWCLWQGRVRGSSSSVHFEGCVQHGCLHLQPWSTKTGFVGLKALLALLC